jgi:hypothetical protein
MTERPWFLATICAFTLALVSPACSPQRATPEDDELAAADDTLGYEELVTERETRAPEMPGAPPATPPGAPPAAAPDTARTQRVTGRVVVSGTATAPITTLAVEDAPAYRLTGALEAELRNLGGAVVRVDGMVAPGVATPRPAWTALEVRSYEIVAIDGERPQVGTLALRDGTWWLDGERSLRLSNVPDALMTHAGAKVWIVGRAAQDELHVQSFGVIRPR